MEDDRRHSYKTRSSYGKVFATGPTCKPKNAQQITSSPTNKNKPNYPLNERKKTHKYKARLPKTSVKVRNSHC